MLNKLSISKKLYLGFSIMIIIMIIVTAIGIVKVKFIDDTLYEVVEINSVKQRYAINFRGSVHDRAIAIRDVVLAKDSNSELFKTNIENIKRLEKYYIKSAAPLDEIIQKGLNVDDEEKEILSKIKDIESKTLPLVNRLIKLKSNNMNEEAKELLVKRVGPNFTIWLKVINQFIDYEEEKNQIETPKAREVASSFTFTMLSILLISLFIALVVSFLISNQLVKSVNLVQEGLLGFFDFLNKKTNKATNIKINGTDEFAQMAKDINSNIKNIENTIIQDEEFVKEIASFAKEIGAGNMQVKIQKDTTTKSLIELKEILTKMQNDLENSVTSSIPKLLNILKSFKEHDFTPRFENSNAKVTVAINELGDVISNLLSDSYEVGKKLENSSKLLIKNVNELNISSNEAASSLEQTTASLTNIMKNVKTNSNHVEEMSQYAKDVNNFAIEGQKFAKNTSVAMTELSQQVTTINDAITIIDQIAFQTNILSLNAAVEAATAGEAGKGFAVVAQEVRNLANRSAQAASEIKSIVEQATNKATFGKQTSDKMINGYDLLIDSIDKTTSIINNIETSSKEQEDGISQINEAIILLEEQTQKNAIIANQTKEIAIENDEIAKEIVNDLSNKKFKTKA
ncbi:methyl-accepting chemotaxis protein [Malaciobacter molluscorum]|uniref:methyl-accepting chemotaxis protein n=1 Tax=Malaciobacter molluscorum TaxID=1032072 RepID=UPI00100BA43C|nr:methyl-accepting chemotaxis protein [Malaciobacter molluscorum]RXJ97470.1 methyl-accepting chemotaxis protein [Malaciobacter molluscorum]